MKKKNNEILTSATFKVGILLIVIGITLFCKGFLLVRKVPGTKSKEPKVIEKSFNKVVILLFDALRFDMVFPNHHKTPQESWRNKLNILYDLHTQDSSRALLFRFKADPPTATTPRISGLTAGNLPTFIEIGDNFSGNSSPQDNWVYQLIKENRKVHFFGDDTWLSLYPYIRNQPKNVIINGFHSFHLFDLDTVDNGIEASMPSVLKSGEFDVIIAHYLGLDHCGHKFGPSHPACGQKLLQYEEIIKRTISDLSEDSLLVVMSDHGMTDEGDHGGISARELSSVLFFYSKQKRWNDTNFSKISKFRNNEISALDLNFFDQPDKIDINTVEHIDFCPTISLLMGLPIPFGNLGKIIPEIFSFLPLQQVIELMQANLKQINKFIDSLGDKNFERAQFTAESSLEEMFTEASRVLKQARAYWTKFNHPLMISGLFLSSVGVGIISFQSLGVLVPSLLFTILLSSTSFVIFEDWLSRFLLAIVYFVKFIYQKDVNYLIAALIVRCSFLLGSCREEQFPYCQVLNHRNFTPSLALFVLFSIIILYFTKEKKNLALVAWWAWTWFVDTNNLPEFLSGSLFRPFNYWFPQFLVAFFGFNLISNHFSPVSIVQFLSIWQRPLSGLFFLVGGGLIYGHEKTFSGQFEQILLPMMWFFTTGHQATVTGIQWEAAYIGNESDFKPLLAAALLLNTLPGHFPTFDSTYLKSILIFHATCLVGTCTFSMILVRHLMIWKIFGPRMIFQVTQFGFYLIPYFCQVFLFRYLQNSLSSLPRLFGNRK
jgi:hypothetical protein